VPLSSVTSRLLPSHPISVVSGDQHKKSLCPGVDKPRPQAVHAYQPLLERASGSVEAACSDGRGGNGPLGDAQGTSTGAIRRCTADPRTGAVTARQRATSAIASFTTPGTGNAGTALRAGRAGAAVMRKTDLSIHPQQVAPLMAAAEAALYPYAGNFCVARPSKLK
jgi:hypothetical protein